MTEDEMVDRLGDAVDKGVSGKFNTIEEALVVAASALNFLMDQIDEEVDDEREESS